MTPGDVHVNDLDHRGLLEAPVTPPYRAVVLTSGHMIDTPDRATPRFPPYLEPAVAARIERVLEGWGIAAGDLVVNGGARGADILFAESAERRSASVEIVLASPPDEFEQTSVALPNSIWSQRFRHILRRHSYVVARRHPDDDPSLNEFAIANAAMIRRVEALSPPAKLHVALVWDEQPAGGPGGTGELAELARRLHAPLAVINPTQL
jgi:hypothetical protein